MKYAPGSFSKNFAWHGTGLRKLHTATKAGFHDTLAPVGLQSFRSDCGLTGDIDLIPINFFLHNKDGQISVDELVFQAVERPHSMRFDRLGLFALHLNRVGSGRDTRSGRQIVSRPAMWANEFVRERLWVRGVGRKASFQMCHWMHSSKIAWTRKKMCASNVEITTGTCSRFAIIGRQLFLSSTRVQSSG